MSKITYNKGKVDAFKAAFQEYQDAKELFKTEMSQFQETMNFMNDSQSYTKASSSSSGVTGYTINDDGIMMRNANTSGTYDSSENTVIDTGDGMAFLTNLEYDNSKVSVVKSNKLYQVGLGELVYDESIENVVTGDDRYVTVSSEPTITDNADCNFSHLSQCSARAKMENKPYYGIRGGVDSVPQSICECYIFDEPQTDAAPERIKTVNVSANIGKDVSAAFLVSMMDGNFYQLTEKIYSDNYNGFYQVVDETDETQKKIHVLMNGDLKDNETPLHPFVGDGINSIEISEIGEHTCASISK